MKMQHVLVAVGLLLVVLAAFFAFVGDGSSSLGFSLASGMSLLAAAISKRSSWSRRAGPSKCPS